MAVQYLTWDVGLKFAIILITAILGFWDEIREHLLKSEEKNKKSSKRYIIGLLFLLLLTLMGEFFDTKKKINDENNAADHLKRQADSAHTMDSNLKVTLKNTETSLDALKNLKGKADSIRQNEHDILDSTNRQLGLIDQTSSALSSFANDSKNKFGKIINPIRTVNIYAVFRIEHLSIVFSDLSVLLKNLAKTKGGSYFRIRPADTSVYNSHAFRPFKTINGQISFLPSTTKEAGKFINPDDFDKTNISLQYLLKNYSDSEVYNRYADQYRQTNSSMLVSPNPAQITYIYDDNNDQLEIVCTDFKIIATTTNNSDLTSPRDLTDPSTRSKFTVNMCFYISNYYKAKNEDIEEYFLKNIPFISITFNNDFVNGSFFSTNQKLDNFLKDQHHRMYFTFPLQTFEQVNSKNQGPQIMEWVVPVTDQGQYLK